jgi:hypothetical protein
MCKRNNVYFTVSKTPNPRHLSNLDPDLNVQDYRPGVSIVNRDGGNNDCKLTLQHALEAPPSLLCQFPVHFAGSVSLAHRQVVEVVAVSPRSLDAFALSPRPIGGALALSPPQGQGVGQGAVLALLALLEYLVPVHVRPMNRRVDGEDCFDDDLPGVLAS